MKQKLITLLTINVLCILTTALAAQTASPGLTLTTTAFADGGIIPDKFTRAAAPANAVSPPLSWTNVPAGTVTFAILVLDPDQALNKGMDVPLHWLIFNIPATATGLPEGVPIGAQLPDGSMQLRPFPRDPPGWVGPAAGPGPPYHHYTFELFALDTKLAVAPDANRAALEAAMQGHILGKGVLVGRFHR